MIPRDEVGRAIASCACEHNASLELHPKTSTSDILLHECAQNIYSPHWPGQQAEVHATCDSDHGCSMTLEKMHAVCLSACHTSHLFGCFERVVGSSIRTCAPWTCRGFQCGDECNGQGRTAATGSRLLPAIEARNGSKKSNSWITIWKLQFS